MQGIWPRLAILGLVGMASLWLTTSVGMAQKDKIVCRIQSDPVPGSYQGKYTALLVASGGSAAAPVEIQYSLSGSLEVKVASGGSEGRARVTAGDGDLAFGYGTQLQIHGGDVGVDIKGGGKGSLEFASGDEQRFVMSGRMGVVSMTAQGAGPQVAVRPQTTSARGGEAELTFKPDDGGDCFKLRGTLEGDLLEQTQQAFQQKGLAAQWTTRSFTLDLQDEHGLGEARQKIQQQMAEVRPKPRPNALLKLRQIHDDMERDAASRPDEEKVCLRKVYIEAYFPLARTWLNEDLTEIKQMSGRAATLTELDRTRLQRLIGQALGRAREAQLAGCGWPEAEGGLSACGDAAMAVEKALLKKNQKLWDGTSVADVLRWARDAALLGGDDGGQALNAVANWASGVAWSQYKVLQALPKGDAGARDQACRDAYAAAYQAQLVGGNGPSADDLKGLCYGGGQ